MLQLDATLHLWMNERWQAVQQPLWCSSLLIVFKFLVALLRQWTKNYPPHNFQWCTAKHLPARIHLPLPLSHISIPGPPSLPQLWLALFLVTPWQLGPVVDSFINFLFPPCWPIPTGSLFVYKFNPGTNIKGEQLTMSMLPSPLIFCYSHLQKFQLWHKHLLPPHSFWKPQCTTMMFQMPPCDLRCTERPSPQW